MSLTSDTPEGRATSEEFLRLFTRNQFRIAGLVRSLVTDPVDASDVMQETSLTLWRGFDQFDAEQDFAKWALGVARHQVLKHWRSKRGDRHVFSETLINELADEVETCLSNDQQRLQALRDCLQKLTNRQRELVKDFYGKGISAAGVAKSWNRNIHAIYNALRSLRKELGECIMTKLSES